MTSRDLLDDDDDMTIEIEKKVSALGCGRMTGLTSGDMLLSGIHRHIVTDTSNPFSFSNISNDGPLMTIAAGCQFRVSLMCAGPHSAVN